MCSTLSNNGCSQSSMMMMGQAPHSFWPPRSVNNGQYHSSPLHQNPPASSAAHHHPPSYPPTSSSHANPPPQEAKMAEKFVTELQGKSLFPPLPTIPPSPPDDKVRMMIVEKEKTLEELAREDKNHFRPLSISKTTLEESEKSKPRKRRRRRRRRGWSASNKKTSSNLQKDDGNVFSILASARKYLMTKTAMQLHGRDLGNQHQGPNAHLQNSNNVGGGNLIPGEPGGGHLVGGREMKAHQCHQCMKAFTSNHQLVQHIRVHTGEKPYKCSYCERRFKQLSHVQQHTRLHTGERPYRCHVHQCGRAFIQLSNLQQHLRNHENQLERLKNRPFHCNICGKGFATEGSLRTHNSKNCAIQSSPVPPGPTPSCCPICQKLCISGEALMEHMKFIHKDPNASGVPAKRRNANHPCPACGKFYVNEGSLRKHMSTTHPEVANQLTSSLRMWPCTVCTAVFTHENGLLSHMDQMRMDPKHQFAAQYVLSRAANERREREALLAAVNMSHFAMAENPTKKERSPSNNNNDSDYRKAPNGIDNRDNNYSRNEEDRPKSIAPPKDEDFNNKGEGYENSNFNSNEFSTRHRLEQTLKHLHGFPEPFSNNTPQV